MEQMEDRSITSRTTPNTRADLPELCHDLWLKIFTKLQNIGDLNVEQYAMPVCKEWRDLGYQLTAEGLYYHPTVERVGSQVRCLRLPCLCISYYLPSFYCNSLAKGSKLRGIMLLNGKMFGECQAEMARALAV